MSPAHRQSCDRCRQQKVRCLRDNNTSVPGPGGRVSASLSCDRCAKAGAECVYSEKQRGHRRRCSVRSPSESKGTAHLFDLGPAFDHVDGTPRLSTGPSHVITTLMDHPSSDLRHVDESETTAGAFGASDAELHLLPHQISPTSISESLATLLADAVSASTIPAVHFYDDVAAPAPLMDIDADHEDTRSFLFSQLTAVSQRAMRTARRLARSGTTGAGAATLTVSSPEVNEALEDTNTLISTVNEIMAAAGRDDDSMTTTDCAGLAFSALACHQNLMTLFRAICDAIQGRLQAKKEEREQQQHHTGRDHSGVGPLNVAHFVMVLQLLMHLISRMDRFLAISPTTAEQESQFIAPAAMLDYSTMSTTDDYAIDIVHPGQSTASSSTPVHHHPRRRNSLLELVQEIVGNMPSERERLKLTIQELQAEMDHAETH